MNDQMPTKIPQPAQPIAIRSEFSVADIRKRKELVHELMRELMVPGQHYGEIPGTDGKPALLKSGAEMLCMTFRLAATFAVHQRDLEHNHREYRIDCTLTAVDGSVVACGVGSASTMESKHRWRLRNLKCPQCGAEAIRKGRDGYFCGQKVGGCGENFSATDKRIVSQPKGKVENPDVADQWNTVLKIAAKRAHTHATLLATAASDMFVVEDDDDDPAEPQDEPKKAAAPQQPPTELTPKQRLMRECLGMSEQLVKAGLSKQQISDELGARGIVMPPKWGDLADNELAIVKETFAELLKAGREVK